MKKKPYRFGMEYFGTRHVWIRAKGLFIKDTHQEWLVSDLWNRYMAPKESPNE